MPMTVDEWIGSYEDSCRQLGIPLTHDMGLHLRETSSTMPNEDVMTGFLIPGLHLFFDAAKRGKTFGPLSQVKDRFGRTLEENYGLQSGPFLDFARTYWTFKFEVEGFGDSNPNILLSKVLQAVELKVASVFFPTRGPLSIPVEERRQAQRELLQAFASDMDIERFIAENPILNAHEGKNVRWPGWVIIAGCGLVAMIAPWDVLWGKLLFGASCFWIAETLFCSLMGKRSSRG